MAAMEATSTLLMMSETQPKTRAPVDDTVYYRYPSNKYELGEGIEKVVLPESAHTSNLMVMGNSEITTYSGDGDDTVMAGDGNDTIYTGSGDDKVDAGSGDDLIIEEGAGDDSYDGGNGIDTIKYTSATDDIIVDLVELLTPEMGEIKQDWLRQTHKH